MNVVFYLRYSSDAQREESIEGQLRDCTQFANYNGMTVVGTYIDRALSAKTDNRPQFQKMIKDSSKKMFEAIIVWKLDRFARNRYDSAHYKNILKKNGVKVVSAKETIAELKNRGYKVVCFSGGFKNATVPLKEKLGLDAEFANILHEKDDKLTGLVGGEMMFNNSKSLMLQKVQQLLGISPDDTVAIGDGANDLGMFEHSKVKIAFCAKEILKKNATVIIDKKDLREILKYV